MITIKLTLAIIAFLVSGGQIVFQTFQHHHSVNPKHGLIKFSIFSISIISLIYLAKDIYADFDNEKNTAATTTPIDKSLEIDYWHNIYNDSSPEGYCAYLEKYPQGEFINIAKHRAGDCSQVAQQVEEQKKIAQKAQTQALVDKALAEANIKFELEAKTVAELKAKIDTEQKISAEMDLKTKINTNNEGYPPTIDMTNIKTDPDTHFQVKSELETEAPNKTQVDEVESLF